MSNLFDGDAADGIALDDPNAVYDRDTAIQSAEPQTMNIHQLRQQRKQGLIQASKSKSQQKSEQTKAARKKMLEKYARRDDVIQGISALKLTPDAASIIAPSHTIGIRLNKKQRYEEAIRRRDLGLSYNRELIEEIDKKRNARTLHELEEIESAPILEAVEPVAPEPRPLIRPDLLTNLEPPKPLEPPQPPAECEETAPSYAINVLVNRPSEIDPIRENLPIIGEEQQIMETINENDVIIICGETGSGKTTQVPQFLYEAGYGTLRTKGRIVVTEPRRVATVNMAKRVAYELGLTFGQQVGYHIRNNRFFASSTVIKFATDGILLREAEEDLLFSQYSVVIIDEAHERTINTDVLIGLLSRIVTLRRRKFNAGDTRVEPLKLIIMSATLRVSDFVDNERLFPTPPPVINVAARNPAS
jgi:ATP-dependent RNA helicase DHX37/DHR1